MHSLKVLVLENSPFQLMAMHQVLNACGVFDVLTAEDVPHACRSLDKRGGVDIAFCDVQAAGSSSMELIRHLGATGLARALVLYSSAGPQAMANAVALAEQQGLPVLDALTKPATSSVVHPLLEGFLGSPDSGCTLPLPEVQDLGCLDGALFGQLRELCARTQVQPGKMP